MNTNTFAKLLAVALLIGTVSTALADDINPPPWARGGPRTTSQEWTFDHPTDINGHPVTTPTGSFFNPYGIPHVMNPSEFVWLPTDQTFNPNNPNPRSGIVCIDGGHILKFMIPNEEHRELQKLIWVQLTWWADPGSNVVVSPLATAPNTGSIVQTLPLGAGWNHTTASYTLAEQPAFEEFWIRNLTNERLYVDQLVIDTKCVPEPASMAALAIGALGVLMRRKHSR